MRHFLILVLFPALCLAQETQDSWQYLGPNRTGVYSGCGWSKTLTASSPKLLWQQKVGTGYSAPVAQNEKIFLPILDDEKNEAIVCLDAAKGTKIWTSVIGKGWTEKKFPGPRASPVVIGDRVYCFGTYGTLTSLSVKDGSRVWSVKVPNKQPTWGLSGSPLLDQGKLYIQTGAEGSSFSAFDAANGQNLWKSGKEGASYGSPMLATLDGNPALLFVTSDGIVFTSRTDGAILVQIPWKTKHDITVSALPLPGNQVFISSGYKSGSALYKIEKGTATKNWETQDLGSHINAPIVFDGRIYGVDGQAGKDGSIVCLDLLSGKTLWTNPIKNFGSGHLVLADGQFLALGNTGLAVVFAPESAYRELARFQLLNGRSWTPPVLLGSRILIRNENTLACYDLAP